MCVRGAFAARSPLRRCTIPVHTCTLTQWVREHPWQELGASRLRTVTTFTVSEGCFRVCCLTAAQELAGGQGYNFIFSRYIFFLSKLSFFFCKLCTSVAGPSWPRLIVGEWGELKGPRMGTVAVGVKATSSPLCLAGSQTVLVFYCSVPFRRPGRRETSSFYIDTWQKPTTHHVLPSATPPNTFTYLLLSFSSFLSLLFLSPPLFPFLLPSLPSSPSFPSFLQPSSPWLSASSRRLPRFCSSITFDDKEDEDAKGNPSRYSPL